MPRYLTLTGSVLRRPPVGGRRQRGGPGHRHLRRARHAGEGRPGARRGRLARPPASRPPRPSAQSQAAADPGDAGQAGLRARRHAVRPGRHSQGRVRPAEDASAPRSSTRPTRRRRTPTSPGKLAGDTVIRAPIDGIIGERYVNVGEYVQPPTRVASVFAINPVRVTISVPEAAVALVKEGQTLDVEVSAYPDRTFPATVRFVCPALRAEHPRPHHRGRRRRTPTARCSPGMFATVQLLVGEEEQPTVPVDAIKADGTIKRHVPGAQRPGLRDGGAHRRRRRTAASRCSSR